jgi:hypothetical protein
MKDPLEIYKTTSVGISEFSGKIKRIENLLNEELGRPDKDAAGVYIPTNMDAHIRIQVFKQCLKILREDAESET